MKEASGKSRLDTLIARRRHCSLCCPFESGDLRFQKAAIWTRSSYLQAREKEHLTSWRRRCLTPHSVPVRWLPQSGLAFCPSVRSRVPLTDRGLQNKGSANQKGKPKLFGRCRVLSQTDSLGVAAAVVTSLPLTLFLAISVGWCTDQGPQQPPWSESWGTRHRS